MEMEMQMEMGMRAMEDIEIGTDITPPLPSLTFSLHTSHLPTHCSSCFSLLSSHSSCSPPCSSADHSSDLCAALRLLLSHRPDPRSGRIAGLLSNRHKLTWHNHNRFEEDEDEISERIRVGAEALAAAIREREPHGAISEEDAAVALCAVLTNAVEVQDKEGRALGIAVFGPTFSWINHSCSPNACYRFILSSPSSSASNSSEESKLRIAPFACGSREIEIDSGVCSSSIEFAKEEGEQGYGPRLIVRSIKKIKKGEEVTVAYTDLLQPKAMRQLDLWSKYKFVCCCKRCSALPFTYADRALQVLRDMADRRLTDSVDNIISDYLTVGDPESSCEKLEKILMQGLNEQLDDIEERSHYKFMLHPLHYLSVNAYTTLASAYKVRAGDFLSAHPETDLNWLEAFDMSRTSAAYSLLLAGATHHLFKSESSLIASVANFWAGCGESLLSLAASTEWGKFVRLGLVVSNLSLVKKLKCSKCSLTDRFRACMSTGQIRSADFESVSDEFIHCISDVTQKVWSFLVYSCHFLKSIKDPIDFSWLMSTNNSSTVDLEAHVSSTGMCCYSNEFENSIQISEEQAHCHTARAHIFELGVHCLAYGGLLACICYGPHSHLASYVQHVLDHEENNI